MERLDIVTLSDANDNEFHSRIERMVGGIERKIKGYQLLSEMLDNFNLNDAHSFGQGEEVNLRRILYNIGEDRIEELRVSIKTVVDRKLKRLRRSLMYHKIFMINSPCQKKSKPADSQVKVMPEVKTSPCQKKSKPANSQVKVMSEVNFDT